jgi:hypothetical protein
MEAMRDDLMADLVEMHETLEWLDAEIAKAPAPKDPNAKRGYHGVTEAQIRTAIQRFSGKPNIKELAAALRCSEGQLRLKLPGMIEAGTVVVSRQGRHVRYMVPRAGVSPSRPKPRRQPQKPTLRAIPGGKAVARTGKRNVKVMKRAGKIKGTKGQ